MGNQNGNLRQQLVRDGTCEDLSGAKAWIGTNCDVQFIEILDNLTRSSAETFMLSIFRPKYCD